ncbi:hypothetical protein SADUNF_Sadunf16G0036000 [Salix dunnii]|uniref:Uncharacterized protein n=1 Tax=Salix dunnii TaxID=1413687 RepID=A0A835J4V3_9ROSI|nr:hypothetical protein SADUNF_Sadunf16G0036000 [Salix dunnii]
MKTRRRNIVTQLGSALIGLPHFGQRLTAINLGTQNKLKKRKKWQNCSLIRQNNMQRQGQVILKNCSNSLPQKLPLVTLYRMWAQEVGRLLDRWDIQESNRHKHKPKTIRVCTKTSESWCYTIPEVNESVDSVLNQFHSIDSDPYGEPQLKLIDDKYRSIDFPFEAVEGADHTGPFKFVAEKLMDLDEYLTYLRSWSAYQNAKTRSVELLRDDMIESFKRDWNEDGHDQKVVKFPVYLRIGKLGSA